MAYTPSLYRLAQADQLRGIVLGVSKLEDRRSWVERSEPQSQGYVMQQGPWRFGLTYQKQEFVPVADLIQTLFVDEFTRAGVEAKPIPKVLTKEGTPAMRAAGEEHGVAYVLGGRVLVFEIVNEQGFWTITSRRSVTLEINLVQVRSGDHTVFRQVVTQIVEQVAAKLALDPTAIAVRVTMIRR